jgi:hypothetical protein
MPDNGSYNVNAGSPLEEQHADHRGEETNLERLQGLSQSVHYMQVIHFLICKIFQLVRGTLI